MARAAGLLSAGVLEWRRTAAAAELWAYGCAMCVVRDCVLSCSVVDAAVLNLR